MIFYFSSIIKSDFFRQRFIKINLFLSLLLNIFLWFFLAFKSSGFSEIIYLHYNIYFGIDLVGPWYQIFFWPFLGILIFLINFFLGAILFSSEKLLSYFLVTSSTLAQVFLIISLMFLMVINF